MLAPKIPAQTLADMLGLLRPRIDPALLDDKGWSNLLRCASDLPANAARCGFALEFICDSSDRFADLSMLTAPDNDISQHFIRHGKTEKARSGHVILGRLFEVVRDRGSHPLGCLSLEFDLAGEVERGLVPGVFMSPTTSLETPLSGYTDPADIMAVLELAGCPRGAGHDSLISTLCAELPTGAYVSQCGLFPARQPPIIRMNIAGVSRSALATFLARIGWTGEPAAATEILACFEDVTPDFRMAIDIHDGLIPPRLGLEMFQTLEKTRLGGDQIDWSRFVTRIEQQGLCRPDKARALRAWPGSDQFPNLDGGVSIHRMFHHFKIDLNAPATRVKAYLFGIVTPTIRD